MSAPPGRAYIAVGMKRALASVTGLPMRSTSAFWMLVLLIPAEVRRSFIISFFDYNIALLALMIHFQQVSIAKME
jgi:hypothetical protein